MKLLFPRIPLVVLLLCASLWAGAVHASEEKEKEENVEFAKTVGQLAVSLVEGIAGSMLLYEGYKWLVQSNPEVAHAYNRLQRLEDRYVDLPETVGAEREKLLTKLEDLLTKSMTGAADCPERAVLATLVAELQKRIDLPILQTPESQQIEQLAAVAAGIHRREVLRRLSLSAPSTVAGLLLFAEAAVRAHLLVLGERPGVLAVYEYIYGPPPRNPPDSDVLAPMQPVGLTENLN